MKRSRSAPALDGPRRPALDRRAAHEVERVGDRDAPEAERAQQPVRRGVERRAPARRARGRTRARPSRTARRRGPRARNGARSRGTHARLHARRVVRRDGSRAEARGSASRTPPRPRPRARARRPGRTPAGGTGASRAGRPAGRAPARGRRRRRSGGARGPSPARTRAPRRRSGTPRRRRAGGSSRERADLTALLVDVGERAARTRQPACVPVARRRRPTPAGAGRPETTTSAAFSCAVIRPTSASTAAEACGARRRTTASVASRAASIRPGGEGSRSRAPSSRLSHLLSAAGHVEGQTCHRPDGDADQARAPGDDDRRRRPRRLRPEDEADRRRVRAGPDSCQLSLVAEQRTRSSATSCSAAPTSTAARLGLGPIGVLPDRQGDGIGAALMEAAIARARDAGEPLVVLLGHPGYYPRFGFVPASTARDHAAGRRSRTRPSWRSSCVRAARGRAAASPTPTPSASP